MTFTNVSRTVLGLGSVGFGVWGLVAPRSLADLMEDKPGYARFLGVRDSIIGALILRSDGATPFVLRMLADLSDVARVGGKNPKMSGGALGFAVWAALAAMATRAERRTKNEERRTGRQDLGLGTGLRDTQ